MSTYRPLFQPQLPDSRCIIDGKHLGGESCTAYAMAMLIDRATLGQKRPTGCRVRALTGDTTGGLTLPQVANAAREYGVEVAVRTGSNTIAPLTALGMLRAGRPIVLQGGTRPLLGTDLRSTAGAINHAVYLNEARLTGNDWDDPDEVDIYTFDSAADGRDRSYHVDQGPTWWTLRQVMAFAAALQPWGEDDPRTLGPGRWYAGIGPDTEPHVILRYGGRKTTPFPDKMRAINPPGVLSRVSVRSRPDRNLAGDITRYLEPGDLFLAYQRTVGIVKHGSNIWYGNQSGREWVPGGGMKFEGGST